MIARINQLFNTHREAFLKPLCGICIGIKLQTKEILDNEYEHTAEIFYMKTKNIKVMYKKETLEIIDVFWIGEDF